MNSGTEFSAVERLKLFKTHKLPAKILTRNYNTQLIMDMKRVDLEAEDVLNLYDYFQELGDDLPVRDASVRYDPVIDKNRYHIEGLDANESDIKYHGELIAKVGIAPSTVGLIGNITYLNGNEEKLSEDIWDRRGFKSSTQYFHPDGSLGPQVFFNRDGQPKIEISRMNIGGQVGPTMYKLLDYKGAVRRFNTEDELFLFFMNELAAQEEAVFINDRPSLVWAVSQVKGARGKWHYLHTPHSRDNRSKSANSLQDYLRPLFRDFASQFDGLIVPTEEQAEEIRKIYPFKQVLALPDCYVEKHKKPSLTLKNREAHTIVYLGRMAADKKPHDAVDVLARLHESIPDAKIVFLGYASPTDVQGQIEQRAVEFKVRNFVEFLGYCTPEKVIEVLQKSAVLINTTEGDAFGMNILEGMSQGLPVVAYRAKYGVEKLIEDGKDGHLVGIGAIRHMAEAIGDIVSTPSKWAEYSKAAYEKSLEFSADAAWRAWDNSAVVYKNV